jgi:hypothetical protein
VSKEEAGQPYTEIQVPEQKVIQIAPAAPGWWAQFSDHQLEPVAVWALVEDQECKPFQLLGAYVAGDEFTTTAGCDNFERFVFDPRPPALKQWLRQAKNGSSG